MSISPTTATADHAAAPPGNQAHFILSDSISGNCPLTPDSIGTWSTSDPTDTTLNTMTAQPEVNVNCDLRKCGTRTGDDQQQQHNSWQAVSLCHADLQLVSQARNPDLRIEETRIASLQ